MPLYDADRLLKLVSQMRESAGHLRRLGGISQDVFLADPDKIASAKYHFIVAIEAAIDMGNHLISRNGYRAPEDYADTFSVLAEAGVVEKSFAEKLKDMARFRNRLVHIYWEIDTPQVYAIMSERLGDFREFIDALARFLGWANLV